jgi:ribonuclease HI
LIALHVVTDGLGALIRQNKKVTWLWGHYDKATNNAMELCAVIEALSILPEGSFVWISTDSACVKEGITEWTGSWIQCDWRTSFGSPVAKHGPGADQRARSGPVAHPVRPK